MNKTVLVIWKLEIEICLGFGIWDLELVSPRRLDFGICLSHDPGLKFRRRLSTPRL
jgi:hypothetical protein